jgi:rod shape determining protein RodA
MMRQITIDLLDCIFLVVLFVILGIGLMTIYSVTRATPIGFSPMPLYLRQFIWIILGLLVFLVFSAIDYHTLARFAYPLYGVTILLLVIVMLIGRTVAGGQRWISLGFISFQPSELAKFSLLLVLAKQFSSQTLESGLNLRRLLFPAGLFLIPMLLVMKQPDLGTALTLSSIFFSMIFVMGLRSRFLIYFSLISLMLAPMAWQIFWNNLKQYQRLRIATFLNPSADPTGSGWQLTQSKIAIGSGGFLGKGFGGGTQSQLKFLPESPTDFIFAVFSEERGLVGIIILFALFAALFWWCIDVAYKSKDLLGILVAVGGVGLIAFHFLVNVGMAMGMLPVAGVPLPLVSYGGSAMITNMGLLGLILSVKMRRLALFY